MPSSALFEILFKKITLIIYIPIRLFIFFLLIGKSSLCIEKTIPFCIRYKPCPQFAEFELYLFIFVIINLKKFHVVKFLVFLFSLGSHL